MELTENVQKKTIRTERKKRRKIKMMKRELTMEELEMVNGGGVDISHVASSQEYDLSHGLPLHIELEIVISAYWKKLWN